MIHKFHKKMLSDLRKDKLDPQIMICRLLIQTLNRIQNCSPDFKPRYYCQYIDDIFVLFTSLEHLEAFQNFLNG